MLRRDLYQYLKDVLNYEVKQGYTGNTPDSDLFITLIKEAPLGVNNYNKQDNYDILIYSKKKDYSILDAEISRILANIKPSFSINNNTYKPRIVSETGDLFDYDRDLIYKGISVVFPVVL
jgi:hypothetical protein